VKIGKAKHGVNPTKIYHKIHTKDDVILAQCTQTFVIDIDTIVGRYEVSRDLLCKRCFPR
jgi:hypothetical protein